MTTTEASVRRTSDTELLVEREFDAPPELLWEAMTRPEHMRQWYGTPETPLIECTSDLRVGGTYRNVSQLPDGSTFAFNGEYLEIERPRRIVFLERYEPVPGAECRATATYDDLGSRTRFTLLLSFSSVEACEGALASGMAPGMLAAYERLDELVRSLR